MDATQLQRIIDRYLDGAASDAERKLIDGWLELKGPDRQRLPAGERHRIEALMLPVIRSGMATSMPSAIPITIRKKLLWPVMRVAALLLLALGIYWINYRKAGNRHATETVTFQSATTGARQLLKLQLHDSTVVWLNSASRLRYPPRFAGSLREVYLDEGEAFFQVAHDAEKPFIVHSGPTHTRVLGTEFNVEAYPGEQELKVSLLSGKVQFWHTGSAPALLKPGGMAVFNRDSREVKIGETGQENITEWTKGATVFNKVSLRYAVLRLAARNGWQVQFRAPATLLDTQQISAVFYRETPEQMLSSILFTQGLHHKLDDHLLIIYQ